MRACIEHVLPHRVDGWAYRDGAPGERLAMQLVLDGKIIAETPADNYREDLKRNGLGDGFYGFAFADIPQANLPSAYLAGRIEVRAINTDSEPVEAVAAFYLKDETEGFVRGQVLEKSSFAEFLLLLGSEDFSNPKAARQSLALLNASRAHFPVWLSSADFLSVAANLAKMAECPHSQRFYEEQLKRLLQPGSPRQKLVPVEREVLPSTYGSLSDWIKTPVSDNLEIVEPRLFSGKHRPSFLQEAGLLVNGTGEGPKVRVLAFREDAFGGETWWAKQAGVDRPVARNLYYLDFELLRSIVDTGGFVIIDMSNEGPIAEPSWIALLNEAVADLGIPPEKLILVNQNLRFEQGEARERFVGQVAVGHFFISQSINVLKARFPDEAKIAQHCRDVLATRKKIDDASLKHFICLNFTPRWFRWATVLHLSLNGLLERGHVSFPGKTNFKLQVPLELGSVLPALRGRRELLEHIPTLLARCPLELDVRGSTTTSPDFDFPIELMTNSLFQIVTESEMSDGDDMLRVTEKVLKPIVGLQPFILIGNPGSLSLLRDMGFRTFSSLFDESYDEIADPVRRLNAVFEQVDRITRLPIEELRAMIDVMTETLVHNFSHLLLIGPLIFNTAVKNRFIAMISTKIQLKTQINQSALYIGRRAG